MMEASGSRFTAAEGGARLANAARERNTIAAEHANFIAMRLMHEEAFNIRGSLFEGAKRTVYLTRPSRVACVAYDISILTDLKVVHALAYQDVYDWTAEMDKKEVLVCTSDVFKQILQDDVLAMANINVMIVDSCHLICKDDNLKYIMKRYKEVDSANRPRILALTYPLFSSIKKDSIDHKNRLEANEKNCGDEKSCNGKSGNEKSGDEKSGNDTEKGGSENNGDDKEVTENDKSALFKIGEYENFDDFPMYEQLEWKIDVLENELCSQADLAEDIDSVKRISSTPTKPKEVIIEYSSHKADATLTESYVELENYMKDTVNDAMKFLDDHRYDPTEIYGEDLYEELKKIPDPTVEPKLIMHQFLYVLEQLGPYAADKAAFSLLTKLEKLKIKIPYERHFLLYCVITTVFVKIRCYAELVFSQFESEREKIKTFSTPKVLRFVEILEKFKPNELKSDTNKTDNENDKVESSKDKLLKEIDSCDFINLGNMIEDTVNAYEANLSEIHDHVTLNAVQIDNESDNDKFESENSNIKSDNNELESIKSNNKSDNNKLELKNSNDKSVDCKFVSPNSNNDGLKSEKSNNNSDTNELKSPNNNDKSDNDRLESEISNDKSECDKEKANIFGFRRHGTRLRGRGRMPRNNASRAQQLLLNPDSLCGIVFMKEPFMAKILFMVVVELSRHHPNLGFLCAQYSAIERLADPVTEPREFEQQRRKQEEVLKKFRMHECNLLLATSALEEGIDLPRCNLVLRWDLPPSYRSHGLCRARARAGRAACALLAPPPSSGELTRSLAVYTALDQIVTRKCGCGVQDEPTPTEEEHADIYTALIKPYTPVSANNSENSGCDKNSENDNDKCEKEGDNNKCVNDGDNEKEGDNNKCENDVDKVVPKSEEVQASVDLSSAIALINRYCGKLPSDTFTRLVPQWWVEQVRLPIRDSPGEERDAYICTLRLPLNCPVKYNIVGHPMPTRVLARRVAALQACRILHKSGELDNHLMPIGKENFKAVDLDVGTFGTLPQGDPNDLARPGTTKRRQYYYKRTAQAFTDCQPIVDATDAEIESSDQSGLKADGASEVKTGKRNMLYAIQCALWCALPERYNTRGRRLHAPQAASQALAILIARSTDDSLQIPSFPVYTRSGEVRVSVEHIRDADVRVSPRRGRLVRRFMRFVFAEVLRVRRRGMTLQSEGTTHNNYYIVPTVKSTRQDGTTKIDVDWSFLELIYKYTEDRKMCSIEKPILWHQDKEERQDIQNDNTESEKENDKAIINDNDKNISENDTNICENHKDISDNDIAADIDNKSDKGQNGDDKSSRTVINDIDVGNETVISDINKEINAKENEETVNKTENDGDNDNDKDFKRNRSDKGRNGYDRSRKVKKMDNPLLKPGEVFVFDPDKYREAVVTPWYRNQDQPQFFLVAEICWNLTPDSAFPSASHTTFRSYYQDKYGVALTQANQPLLDVDHTSARLNLLTPRYVNRKGVALPVSSERTRRAKRDRLDQKQILVPELCRVHPFPAPLWFATVALPCILYRINALLIADEIRQAVATEVGLGVAKITEENKPNFQWPPLDFGWSLAEVLSADSEKNEKKKEEEDQIKKALEEAKSKEDEDSFKTKEDKLEDGQEEKTLNDILQAEKEEAESGFEIGTWSNEMASSLPADERGEVLEPLPPNLTFCTSASGGKNWCEPEKQRSSYASNGPRNFSMADSDCSYISSDFDTDDSDLNSVQSDDETDTSGFGSGTHSNATMGVRIEYKTAHEAEAFDLERKGKTYTAPAPDERDDAIDKMEQEQYLKGGGAPEEFIEKFRSAVEEHKQTIIKSHLIKENEIITEVLPEQPKEPVKSTGISNELLNELFPFESDLKFENGTVNLESVEKNKRLLLNNYKTTKNISNLNCFSMKDVDIDSPDYKDNKKPNFDFTKDSKPYVPYYKDDNGRKLFDFDYQPDLEGHPGPSPSVILQALTMSNANDGINLERLETIGDSFLKFAITAYLYCALPAVHEGKLSHMRSKQVSNLNLYRLGRARRLGALMIASKFEPHDNWLPPGHRAPPPVSDSMQGSKDNKIKKEVSVNDGCFIPYNLITQHSIPDKSIADCVEALIGAYLIECGPRGALLFMSWLGIRVLPTLNGDSKSPTTPARAQKKKPVQIDADNSESEDSSDEHWLSDDETTECSERPIYGELVAPPSPLLRYISDPEGELERMLSGYSALEDTLQYRFKDRSLLLQALTHASHSANTLTDCYQRLEFLGDAILDYLITRHLYEEPRRHSPGALTDLRSALVNNTIFSTLAVRHGLHKYFRHMSPGLNEVLTKYVKIQEENGHSISEEHYLIQEDEMEQAEDVEVPKALGDLFESVAGAIFLDSGMSLSAVWRPYERLMSAELEAFSAAAPKSPVRELLEAEPDTAKFGKPERLADGRRVRVAVEVFGRGSFKGVGRNYRIAKGTAARCALRHLRRHKPH